MAANAQLGVWPDVINIAPADVLGAYQYAVSGPRALLYIPSYCGCGSLGAP